jgi:deazaflavin-dependent oxidoreductase (nitroreductase family)
MHFPRFMRSVNRVFTNPVMGTFAWIVPPLAVVHHTGRKSGKPYKSPVIALASERGFVIPMTYGRDVDWARNLVAARGGEIERMGSRTKVRNPRIVGLDEARSHLAAPARAFFGVMNFPGFVVLDAAKTR